MMREFEGLGFAPADILLPQGCDLTKWAVVACDQYTSQPEYWDEVARLVGDAPSSLHLMIPEAWRNRPDMAELSGRVDATMEQYLQQGLFRELRDSYVLVTRRQRDGRVRWGLLGLVDLEAYEYAPRSKAPIRASEGTVESRLPPRVAVRRGAPLELSHVMVFLDDPANSVIAPLATQRGGLEQIYDFSLMCDSGHLTGWRVTGEAAAAVNTALEALMEPEQLRQRYGSGGEDATVFALGDGNHSLATAKLCWQEIKQKLSPAEQERHPARYSLVELVNIHDAAIDIEPIHRLLSGVDGADFAHFAAQKLTALEGEKQYPVGLYTAGVEKQLTVSAPSIGALIAGVEELLQAYTAAQGGEIDFIHGDATLRELARQPGNAGLLLPVMEKGELFSSIHRSGVFPRKSFSVGHGEDKRFYLEAHRIR